jgi:hypothetical protein
MSYHRNKDSGFKSALFFDYYKSDNSPSDQMDRLSLGKEGRLKPCSKSSDHNLNEFNLISKDLLDEIEDSNESKQRSTLSTLRTSSEAYQHDDDDMETSRGRKLDSISHYPFTTRNANPKSIDDISFFPKNFNINNYRNSNGIINPTNTLTRNIPAYMPNFSKTPVIDSRSFMYGKLGWICSFCKNFNYESKTTLNLVRSKCNRCGKPQENESNPFEENNSKESINNSNVTTQESEHNESNSSEKKKKKPFVERVGDWVCIKCKNLNFSFRMICNRCQLSKGDSEKLFEDYMNNLMKYAKFNEMLQNQILNGGNQISPNMKNVKSNTFENSNMKYGK